MESNVTPNITRSSYSFSTVLPIVNSNYKPRPGSVVLAGEEKKYEYAKTCTKGRGVSYGKIGLTTVTVTQDLLSGMPLVL